VNNTAPNIIPVVRHWQRGHGDFEMNANTVFKYQQSISTRRTVAIFLEDLNTLQAIKQCPPIKSNTHKNYIIIKITAKQQLAQLQKESYSLAIKPGQIIIKAMDEAGVFYATRTSLQLID
jgi:hexosaminidase